jgi:hypothetical protein
MRVPLVQNSQSARVRISKITPKAGGAVVSVLPTAPNPDDTNFIPTLLWAIDEARKGKLAGYAMAFTVIVPDGAKTCIECAKAWEDKDSHHVLGLIERMKINYIQRTWPEESE